MPIRAINQTTAVVAPDRPMPLLLSIIIVQHLLTMLAALSHLTALLHLTHAENFQRVHDPAYDLLDLQCHSPIPILLCSRKSSSVTYSAKSIMPVPARFASWPVPTLRLTPQSLRDVDFLTLPQSTITSNTSRSIACSPWLRTSPCSRESTIRT